MSSTKNQEPPPDTSPQQPGASQDGQGKANAGRDSKGRFSKGNKGGPGNPFARQTAAMRKTFVAVVDEEEMRAIAKSMIEKAKQGDVAAARLVCGYVMGRPGEAPDPDRLDEMEWQQWQRDTTGNAEVAAVLGGVSTTMACGIARNGVPAIQESNAQIISQGLQEFEQTLQEEAADELTWETDETPQAQAELAAQQSAEEAAAGRVVDQVELDRLRQNIRDAAAQSIQEQEAEKEEPAVLPINQVPVPKHSASPRRAANPPESPRRPDRQETGVIGPPPGQNGTAGDNSPDRPAG